LYGPAVQVSEVHTSGVSHLRLEQLWIVLDDARPRQPKDSNIDSGIHQHCSIASRDQLGQYCEVGKSGPTVECIAWLLFLAPFGRHRISRSRIVARCLDVQQISYQILPIVRFSSQVCWLPEKLVQVVSLDAQMTGTIFALTGSTFWGFHHQLAVFILQHILRHSESARCISWV
jgi:hypothetical protein